jgi:sugar transferase (PEP-CTERM/EpsH1 system associated)
MDFIDVDSQKWLDYAATSRPLMKMAYRREANRLRAFEKKVASLCNLSVFAAEREAALFREIAPLSLIKVVQNGVDTEGYGADAYRKNKIVFVGAMDYLPNIDAMLYFTRKIFPLIQGDIPDIELFIIGSNPSPKIKTLERLRNVRVTGYVKDVKPYLSDAAASVVPLRIARGVQNKILEAMAHGVPVIATTAALDGIEARPGTDVLVGDDPQSFAKSTVAVLKNRHLRQRLAANAMALVRKKYAWESRLTVLEDSIRSACRKECQ